MFGLCKCSPCSGTSLLANMFTFPLTFLVTNICLHAFVLFIENNLTCVCLFTHNFLVLHFFMKTNLLKIFYFPCFCLSGRPSPPPPDCQYFGFEVERGKLPRDLLRPPGFSPPLLHKIKLKKVYFKVCLLDSDIFLV